MLGTAFRHQNVSVFSSESEVICPTDGTELFPMVYFPGFSPVWC